MMLPSTKENRKGVESRKGVFDRVASLNSKFHRNYTDYGLWISSKKSIAYVCQSFYRKIIYHLYELNLNKYVDTETKKSRYVFRLIQPEESQLIDQIEEMEEWLQGKLRNKLQRGCLCMAVMDNDKVIGFNYVSIGDGYIPLLSLRIITGPKQAWSEQITISSDYRRQGLGSLLRSHFYKELRSRGITNLYGHRQEFNIASRQSARKFTAGILARAEYTRVLHLHRLQFFKSVEGRAPKDADNLTLTHSGRKKTSAEMPVSKRVDKALFAVKIRDLK